MRQFPRIIVDQLSNGVTWVQRQLMRHAPFEASRVLIEEFHKSRDLGEVFGLALDSYIDSLNSADLIHTLDRLSVCANGPKFSYSQEGEDLLLARFLLHQVSGKYVDVGCNSPRRYSNTYLLYLHGWRGICIDANVTMDLREDFGRFRPEDVLVQAAVGPPREKHNFHKFLKTELSTFSAELANQYQQSGEILEGIETRNLTSLSEIVGWYGKQFQSVDLLSLDVEGYELQVLETIDWNQFRATFIVAELLGASVSDAVKDPVTRYLNSRNYDLICVLFNSVIYRWRGYEV